MTENVQDCWLTALGAWIAASISCRRTFSLTGSAVKLRTARRLLIASLRSMVLSLHAISFRLSRLRKAFLQEATARSCRSHGHFGFSRPFTLGLGNFRHCCFGEQQHAGD